MREPTARELRVELRARLGVLRHNTGGTYLAAAAATDVAPTTISGWNRGLHKPRSTSMEKLRAAS